MRRVIVALYLFASALAEEKSSARNARQIIYPLDGSPQLYSYQHTEHHPTQYSSYPYGEQYDHSYVPEAVLIQYQPLAYDNIPSSQSLSVVIPARQPSVVSYHHNPFGAYFNSQPRLTSYPRTLSTTARGSGSSSAGLQPNNAFELPFSYYNVASYFPRAGFQNTNPSYANRNDVNYLTQTTSLGPQTFQTTPSRQLTDSYRGRNAQTSRKSISSQSAIRGTNTSRLFDSGSQLPSGLHNTATRPSSYRVVEA